MGSSSSSSSSPPPSSSSSSSPSTLSSLPLPYHRHQHYSHYHHGFIHGCYHHNSCCRHGHSHHSVFSAIITVTTVFVVINSVIFSCMENHIIKGSAPICVNSNFMMIHLPNTFTIVSTAQPA